jgi:hypothetical protein
MSSAEAHVDEVVPEDEGSALGRRFRGWRASRARSTKVPGMLMLTLFCLVLMGIALATLSTRDDAVPRSPHSAPSSPAVVAE